MTESTVYLLDTTALIDFSKGFEPSKSKILSIIDRGELLGVCSITVAEFATGLSSAEHQQAGVC